MIVRAARRPLPLAFAAACAAGFAGRPTAAPAQAITVYAEAYEQAWTGAGSSIPLYLFNHFSMPPAGQAEAVDLIVDDLDLAYIQDYPDYLRPSTDPDFFQRRVDYFRAALEVNPDLQVALVGSLYPPDLRRDTVIDGREERRLDTTRDDIYAAVAGWYLEMMTYFAERGVAVDILNLVNEPDFRTRRFGVGAQPTTEEDVARLFDRAVDSLRAYVADPARNPEGVAMPLIMGPSTIGPAGAVTFIQYMQREVPEAYDNIDIVSFHQYQGGTSSAIATLDRITGDKPLHQSEMHTNRGENVASINGLPKAHRGVLSLARTFSAAINQGANAWYYFLNVFPDDDSNPGLLQVRTSFDRPRPFRHYYAFRQLVSQPVGARRVDRDADGVGAEGDVVTFREEGTDTVVVHYANYTAAAREVSLEILADEGGGALPIAYVDHRVTDATADDSTLARVQVDSALAPVALAVTPFSLNTFRVVLGTATGLAPKRAPAESLTVLREGGDALAVRARGVTLGEVRLVSAAGRVVARAAGRDGRARLSTAGLVAGVYVVTARTDRGVATRRVVMW